MFKKAAFALARTTRSAWLVGTVFTYLSPLLPVKRLYADALVLVFHHPAPAWPFHVLAVPRLPRRSFAALDLCHPLDEGLVLRLLWSLQQAALHAGLARYRVLLNGGRYQEVPQLHLHLIAGPAAGGRDRLPTGYAPYPGGASPPAPGEDGPLVCYAHPHPARRLHEILALRGAIPAFGRLDFQDLRHMQALLDLLRLAQQRAAGLSLPEYALVFTAENRAAAPGSPPAEPLHAHLISGPPPDRA